jgi:hypothetical protein
MGDGAVAGGQGLFSLLLALFQDAFGGFQRFGGHLFLASSHGLTQGVEPRAKLPALSETSG